MYVIPHQTDSWLNSTNGFTIGKRYEIIAINDRRTHGTVMNDNNHARVVPLDGRDNAHLQYRPFLASERTRCAGYFEVCGVFPDNIENQDTIA